MIVHLLAPTLWVLLTGAMAHDFHVSMARMAVEKNQIMLQIRLFEDDLELGLQQFYTDDALKLSPDSGIDTLFTRYANSKLVIQYEQQQLHGTVASSGEDELYGYPIWWFTLMYESSGEISALSIDYQVLMEIFEDQQNVLRITHYPSEDEKMYYMVPGKSEITVEF